MADARRDSIELGGEHTGAHTRASDPDQLEGGGRPGARRHPRFVVKLAPGQRQHIRRLLTRQDREQPLGARDFVTQAVQSRRPTHDLIDRVRERYDKEVEVLYPRAEELQQMVGENGVNLFYESLEKRKLCCRIRKVEPMRRYLATLDGYVTGLRRDQNVTRTDTPKVLIDQTYGGIVKINPIADWTQDQVWQYVRKHDVPVNSLHQSGYPSVGCEPCTRAIKPGEDERAGRWWWENPETKECGLHEQGAGI